MTPQQAALLDTLTPPWATAPAGKVKNVQGHVYFIQALVGGPVKVGWAIDVNRRVREQRWRWAPPFIVLATFNGTHRDENRVHRALSLSSKNDPPEQGLQGREWFRPTADVERVLGAFGGELLRDPLRPEVMRARLVCVERDIRECREHSRADRVMFYDRWLHQYMETGPCAPVRLFGPSESVRNGR